MVGLALRTLREAKADAVAWPGEGSRELPTQPDRTGCSPQPSLVLWGHREIGNFKKRGDNTGTGEGKKGPTTGLPDIYQGRAERASAKTSIPRVRTSQGA